MKVSVIIPFHRGEEYLRDCLDSLVVQTYSDIEVIVVNDHAPEDDLACLAEYENILNLKLYHLHDKTGVAAARNLGLDEAAGDYIFFLDSDDYLYENAIELLVTGAQERDDDITYGKKKPTWFQRSVYFLRKQEEQEEREEQEAQDREEEQDENDLEAPGLRMEEDQEDDSQENVEDSDDEADDSDGSYENKDSKQDIKDIKNHQTDDEGYVSDNDLSQEEITRRREARTRMAYRILVSKRKGIRNISVLGILYKRSLIEENNLRFPENLIYFSTYHFLWKHYRKQTDIRKDLELCISNASIMTP